MFASISVVLLKVVERRVRHAIPKAEETRTFYRRKMMATLAVDIGRRWFTLLVPASNVGIFLAPPRDRKANSKSKQGIADLGRTSSHRHHLHHHHHHRHTRAHASASGFEREESRSGVPRLASAIFNPRQIGICANGCCHLSLILFAGSWRKM